MSVNLNNSEPGISDLSTFQPEPYLKDKVEDIARILEEDGYEVLIIAGRGDYNNWGHYTGGNRSILEFCKIALDIETSIRVRESIRSNSELLEGENG